jgi:spore coat protein U-like protein
LYQPRRHVHLIAACLGLAGSVVSGAAHAAIDCSVSTSGVGFGDYDPLLATPDDSSANVAVTCTRVIFVDPFSVSYTLSLSRGSSGTYSPRRMNAGSARLNYNLYRDAARAQVWGDGTNATGTVAGTASFVWFQTSQTVNHTVYGRVPAQQNATPGAYTDTIVMTITF